MTSPIKDRAKPWKNWIRRDFNGLACDRILPKIRPDENSAAFEGKSPIVCAAPQHKGARFTRALFAQ
jgi:hypothetical protein